MLMLSLSSSINLYGVMGVGVLTPGMVEVGFGGIIF